MTTTDVLNLDRIARNINNLVKAAHRLDEARRKMRDAVKGDTGNGGDDWKALRAVTAELMAECDKALYSDLEWAADELKRLADGLGMATR
jgi:hypothetical protein